MEFIGNMRLENHELLHASDDIVTYWINKALIACSHKKSVQTIPPKNINEKISKHN